MTVKKSDTHFILATNRIYIVMGGIRLCTDEFDFNVKYDSDTNLFATYCTVCQNKNHQ